VFFAIKMAWPFSVVNVNRAAVREIHHAILAWSWPPVFLVHTRGLSRPLLIGAEAPYSLQWAAKMKNKICGHSRPEALREAATSVFDKCFRGPFALGMLGRTTVSHHWRPRAGVRYSSAEPIAAPQRERNVGSGRQVQDGKRPRGRDSTAQGQQTFVFLEISCEQKRRKTKRLTSRCSP